MAGESWIRAAASYVSKSRLVADRSHLMKYIDRVARYTLDEEGITKGRFYKYIYKNKLLAAKKLLTRIRNHCEGSDRAVEDRRTYLVGNWEYIQRAFHDKYVLGCSAEDPCHPRTDWQYINLKKRKAGCMIKKTFTSSSSKEHVDKRERVVL